QRGALRGRVGGKQAKTVLSSGSPYRFCVGARRRRTWVRWSGDHRSFLRALRDSRISGLHQGANLVWPLPGDRHHDAHRYPGTDQCLCCNRVVADQRSHIAVRQLWRIFLGDQPDRCRDFAEHLAGSAGRTRRDETAERTWMGKSTMTIVIAAGGTGGHLYPAVALAREFLRRDPSTNILFVGTVRGVESRVLALEGFELALITAKPVMGKGLLDVARGMLSVPIGIWQSLDILKRQQADLVIGVGGYTSPSVLVA